ncbi:hypothetical protein ABFU82_05875 [Nocardioides sp. WV_118_6]
MFRLHFRLRPGMFTGVVALLALVVALSGGAYAAGKITGQQIAKNAITSKHIKNGQVTSADLSAEARTRLTGPRGAAGTPGTPGVSGYQVVTGTSAKSTGAGDWVDVTVSCPAGKKVLTHGVTWTKLDPDDIQGIGVFYSSVAQGSIIGGGTGVKFYGYAPSMPQNWGIVGQVVCANVS